MPFRLDVTREEDWRSVAAKSQEVGEVDIVVNNAGYFRNRSIDELDLSTWRKTIATNLDSHGRLGTAFLLKYVLRLSLRCFNMPLCSSELSSRCRLEGRVWRNSANSERYHHFSGRVRVAASKPCLTVGKRLSSAGAFLRMMRILLSNLRMWQVRGRCYRH